MKHAEELSNGIYDKEFYEGVWNSSPSTRARWFATIDAAIDALRPNLDTMDGAVMNAICKAFGWPTNAGNFPGAGGLTAACARAVDAYLDAALENGK